MALAFTVNTSRPIVANRTSESLLNDHFGVMTEITVMPFSIMAAIRKEAEPHRTSCPRAANTVFALSRSPSLTSR
jgi:hypothetical protein